MATSAMVGFTPPSGLDLVVEGLDPEVVGARAVIEVAHTVTVQDSRPVHAREVLHSEPVTLDGTDLILPITLAHPAPPYAFDGSMVTVDVEVVLKIPRQGWFVSDKVLAEVVVSLPRVSRTASPQDAALMEPKDDWSLELVLASLGPDERRAVALRVGLFAAAVAGGLAFAVWTGWCMLYVFWLGGVLIGGKLLQDNLKDELSGYAGLAWGNLPPLGPDSVLPVGRLLDGRPTVDVERPRLRIVACNLERGQYKRGSGTDVRTVSFSEPIGAVVLYDRQIERWPVGRPLEYAFEGDVDFGPAFAALLPPVAVGEDHGIGIRLEAQLVVPDLLDVELEGPTGVWRWPVDWRPA